MDATIVRLHGSIQELKMAGAWMLADIFEQVLRDVLAAEKADQERWGK